MSIPNVKNTELGELLVDVVRALVDEEDVVWVEETHGERTILFELHVHQDDFGKVVGRKGATVIALRKFFIAAAGKLHKNIRLDIVDEQRQ